MNINRGVLWLVLALFGVLTILAVMQHGPDGILRYQLANLAGLQVLVDLFIALALFIVWMWPNARAKGRNPWVWLAITLVIGSFGPLLYLLLARESQGK
jgi:Terpene cyclase DEP1